MKTIGIKIGFGYFLALALLLTVGTVAYRTLGSLGDSIVWVSHTNQVMLLIQDIRLQLIDAESGQRGYLLHGEDAYLAPYSAGSSGLHNDIAELKQLTSDNPNQQGRISRLEPAVNQVLAAWQRAIDLRGQKGFEAALAVSSAAAESAGMDGVRQLLAEMYSEESALLDQRNAKQTSDIEYTDGVIFWGSGLAVLLLTLVGFWITRNIAQPLGEITRGAEKLTQGEIDLNVPDYRRTDEVGKLARAFTQMTDYIKEVAATAQAIAAGNLDRVVVPRSNRDALGAAFVAMQEALRNTAGIADSIAAGDLTVRVAPRSERDVLGRALSQMVESLTGQVKGMGEGANVLAAAASEIMASTAQLTATASESAAAVSETSTTVEEVKQTSHLSNKKAAYVSETARRAVDVSVSGRDATEATIRGMNHIKEQMEAIAETVIQLSEQSQTIGAIITTVNDLAEQSNLLSVNASIEAAKAGEQGKGFAVVAQEIRSLAEQSKRATAQVQGVLHDIQKATAAAVMATEKGSKAVDSGVAQSALTDEAIRKLAEAIQESSQAADQISASTQQQLAGMDQIANAMDSIKQATSQNVASMQQVETSARSLNDLGQKLKELIQRYKA